MTAKEYLTRYRDLGRSIDAKQEQVRRLREQATQITQALNPDKVQSSSGGDSLCRAVEQIVDAMRGIESQIKEREAARQEIENTIGQVKDGTQRALLEYRYLSCYTFEQIAVKMNYSYKQICRIHGKSLGTIRDVIECPIAPVV